MIKYACISFEDNSVFPILFDSSEEARTFGDKWLKGYYILAIEIK